MLKSLFYTFTNKNNFISCLKNFIYYFVFYLVYAVNVCCFKYVYSLLSYVFRFIFFYYKFVYKWLFNFYLYRLGLCLRTYSVKIKLYSVLPFFIILSIGCLTVFTVTIAFIEVIYNGEIAEIPYPCNKIFKVVEGSYSWINEYFNIRSIIYRDFIIDIDGNFYTYQTLLNNANKNEIDFIRLNTDNFVSSLYYERFGICVECVLIELIFYIFCWRIGGGFSWLQVDDCIVFILSYKIISRLLDFIHGFGGSVIWFWDVGGIVTYFLNKIHTCFCLLYIINPVFMGCDSAGIEHIQITIQATGQMLDIPISIIKDTQGSIIYEGNTVSYVVLDRFYFFEQLKQCMVMQKNDYMDHLIVLDSKQALYYKIISNDIYNNINKFMMSDKIILKVADKFDSKFLNTFQNNSLYAGNYIFYAGIDPNIYSVSVTYRV